MIHLLSVKASTKLALFLIHQTWTESNELKSECMNSDPEEINKIGSTCVFWLRTKQCYLTMSLSFVMLMVCCVVSSLVIGDVHGHTKCTFSGKQMSILNCEDTIPMNISEQTKTLLYQILRFKELGRILYIWPFGQTTHIQLSSEHIILQDYTIWRTWLLMCRLLCLSDVSCTD